MKYINTEIIIVIKSYPESTVQQINNRNVLFFSIITRWLKSSCCVCQRKKKKPQQ